MGVGFLFFKLENLLLEIPQIKFYICYEKNVENFILFIKVNQAQSILARVRNEVQILWLKKKIKLIVIKWLQLPNDCSTLIFQIN